MQKYPEADNIQKIRLGINCINQPNFDTIQLSGVQETEVAAKQSQPAGSAVVGSVRGGAAEIASAAGRNWEGRRRWSRRREDGGEGAAGRHIKKKEPGTVAVSLTASLSGSPKGGGGLLSHLVGQYHRRGRA